MLYVHYDLGTGLIVSYSNNDGGAPKGTGIAAFPADTAIWNRARQINKKIRLRDGALVPFNPSLLGERRARVLSDRASECPAGDFVEVGVYKGGTAIYLGAVAKAQGRKLHLFDTFTGIPVKGPLDDNNVGDFGDVDVEEVKEYVPEGIFHVGVFPETVDASVQNIAFGHIDGDIYHTTKAAKTHIWDRMVKGGKLFFDDIELKGVMTALKEEFGPYMQNDRELRMIYVVKP